MLLLIPKLTFNNRALSPETGSPTMATGLNNVNIGVYLPVSEGAALLNVQPAPPPSDFAPVVRHF